MTCMGKGWLDPFILTERRHASSGRSHKQAVLLPGGLGGHWLCLFWVAGTSAPSPTYIVFQARLTYQQA